MKVQYDSGSRTYIMMPRREAMAKQLAHRDYNALSKTFVNAHASDAIDEIGKVINQEIRHICSLTHNSLLRCYGADIKNFSWERVWDELKENVPKLVLLVSLLCPKGSIILRSTIICMLLKQSNPKMSLLQRVANIYDFIWKWSS